MPHNKKTKKTHNEKDTFVTIIIFLLVVSIVTTITNVVIIYKLGLVPGFKYFKINNDGDQVIVHKNAQINKLVLARNKVSRLSSILGNLEFKTQGSRLRIDKDGVQVIAKKGLEIVNSENDQQLYPFDIEKIPLAAMKSLSVPKGLHDVKSIRSPMNEDLNIMASKNIRIRGNEGVKVEGKHVEMMANDLIFLSSINGSIIFDGHTGIFLNMNSFKHNLITNTSGVDLKWQYKLCLCGKNGRLFRISVKDQRGSCADARFPQSRNPCA